MQGQLSQWFTWLWRASFALSVIALHPGCEARGVGDPCIPESIPSGGFVASEVYVETSAVQCRTRTCIVFNFTGNPECQFAADGTCPAACAGSCQTPQEVLEHVHCSCRCSAGGGDTNLPLCACSEGFHCVEVLTAGGAGVRGGYCVTDTADPNFCATMEDCPAGLSCINNQCTTG